MLRPTIFAALGLVSLSGCSALNTGDEVPFDNQGLPAAPTDQVNSMFEMDATEHPDGSPKVARYDGMDMGEWVPVGSTSNGCIEYQLVPERSLGLKKPEVTHYWHGDQYRVDPEGCKPVREIVHSAGKGDAMGGEERQPKGVMPSEQAGGQRQAGAPNKAMPRQQVQSGDSSSSLPGKLPGRPSYQVGPQGNAGNDYYRKTLEDDVNALRREPEEP